ncbi:MULTISPECIES: DUF1127 domain-containing protein [Cohaesibacter]|uniref:DUF1127 domain-containing protein n=1 Tax=Cohaesibacter TaxID=655352 RepID=UPI000DE8C5E5|nr:MULTISPECIES: DUF1127 domain-containing protein [Cohaesibacter]TLP45635.1 DUF1127 domain-containing protein [Cohaesibacter sp. CAU 1516]
MLTAGLFSALSSAARGLRRLGSTLTTISRNRRALSRLDELDAHTLADIGLTRGDIVSARVMPFYQDPFLIDPFEDRRRIKAAELEALARWPRPMPEQPYLAPRTIRCGKPASGAC